MGVNEIGRNIENMMHKKGIRKAELSRRTGVAMDTIKKHIETGKMSTDYLVKYAEGLGCEVPDLLENAADYDNFTAEVDVTSFYPWNLCLAIYCSPSDGKEAINEAKKKAMTVYIPGLIDAVKGLSDREQKILSMRFEKNMTLEQCSNVIGVTRERIRQAEAKALRKLRSPYMARKWHLDVDNKCYEIAKERDAVKLENIILRDKVDGIMKSLGVKPEQIEQPEQVKKRNDINIDELELSVRSYNVLRRNNINFLSDFEGLTFERIMKFRNMGLKSAKEIESKLMDCGIILPHETDE